MGAVEHQVGGKKQLFIHGSATNYPLNRLVSCLSELQSSVDLGLLVASHDDTPASAAVIAERGGRSAVGNALQPFRKTIRALLQKYSAIFYETGIASRSADGGFE